MYDINLIRSRVVPQRQKDVFFSLLMAGGLGYVLTIVAIVVFAMSGSRTVAVYASQVEELKESVRGGQVPTRSELEATMKRMEPVLEDVDKMLKRRADIVELWTGVAAAVPDSVWLTSVRVSPPRPRSSSSKRRGGRSTEGAIYIQGAVAAGIERGGEIIRKFAQRLEEQPELANRISDARSSETGVQRIGDEDVIGFEITCPME